MARLTRTLEIDESPSKKYRMYQNESDAAVFSFLGALGTVALIVFGLGVLILYLALR